MASSPIDLLVAHWRDRDVKLNPGATEAEITALEQALGRRLPADLRAFYARVNGMAKGTADELLFSLWPLEVILAARAEGRTPLPLGAAAIAFSDFLLDSHFYAVNLADQHAGQVGLVWPDGSLECLADSFESFLARYWSAPETLYMFDR